MNIGCAGSPGRIDAKKSELQKELNKPKEFQNKQKIRRLIESIKRNEKIARNVARNRRWKKRY